MFEYITFTVSMKNIIILCVLEPSKQLQYWSVWYNLTSFISCIVLLPRYMYYNILCMNEMLCYTFNIVTYQKCKNYELYFWYFYLLSACRHKGMGSGENINVPAWCCMDLQFTEAHQAIVGGIWTCQRNLLLHGYDTKPSSCVWCTHCYKWGSCN